MAVAFLQMIGEELFISVGGQAMVFAKSCTVGMAIAAVYECFRFLRCMIKHHTVLVAVEDVAFCIAAAVFSFHFWLYAARGELRAFIIIGEWFGAGIYFLTLGRLINKAERMLVKALRRAVSPIITTIKAHFRRKNKAVKNIALHIPEIGKGLLNERALNGCFYMDAFAQKKRK